MKKLKELEDETQKLLTGHKSEVGRLK